MKKIGKVGLGALLLVGAIGVLHLPCAAPLLRAISPASLCPITRGTPAQIDRAHAISSAAIRGASETAAPARPALGFELDKTRRADLDAWAAKHGVSCGSIAGNANLQKCKNVPAAAVGQAAWLADLEEVSFEFQSSGELVNVQTLRRHLTPEQVARAVSELERNAASTLGPPTTQGGASTVAHLSRGPLSSYIAVHQYSDYRATASATNLGSSGVMVREEYISAL